ncbi:metal-binding protein [Methylobacterium sp. Leaf122]|nr:metal-binding protein [Methylobacterium sp. Leaf122]
MTLVLLSRRTLLSGLSSLVLAAPLRAAEPLPEIQVTKDPSCGCCAAWVDHIRAAGYPVHVTEAPVNPLKARLGVPRSLASCHTAQVGGYVIEGHVPAGAITRLLAEKPQATGLAVPGMPVGSPGMEIYGMPPDTYEVVLFGPDLQRPFERYRGGTPL